MSFLIFQFLFNTPPIKYKNMDGFGNDNDVNPERSNRKIHNGYIHKKLHEMRRTAGDRQVVSDLLGETQMRRVAYHAWRNRGRIGSSFPQRHAPPRVPVPSRDTQLTRSLAKKILTATSTNRANERHLEDLNEYDEKVNRAKQRMNKHSAVVAKDRNLDTLKTSFNNNLTAYPHTNQASFGNALRDLKDERSLDYASEGVEHQLLGLGLKRREISASREATSDDDDYYDDDPSEKPLPRHTLIAKYKDIDREGNYRPEGDQGFHRLEWLFNPMARKHRYINGEMRFQDGSIYDPPPHHEGIYWQPLKYQPDADGFDATYNLSRVDYEFLRDAGLQVRLYKDFHLGPRIPDDDDLQPTPGPLDWNTFDMEPRDVEYAASKHPTISDIYGLVGTSQAKRDRINAVMQQARSYMLSDQGVHEGEHIDASLDDYPGGQTPEDVVSIMDRKIKTVGAGNARYADMYKIYRHSVLKAMEGRPVYGTDTSMVDKPEPRSRKLGMQTVEQAHANRPGVMDPKLYADAIGRRPFNENDDDDDGGDDDDDDDYDDTYGSSNSSKKPKHS